ncbi:hypothetical protein [Sphingomonas jaspsi]|uniref:hypothetical protein n=1 Tax=Sphingomonas jaspsi TaxID=392409 RepID=UPI0012EBCBBD|nr:hypothetical protein [Sphingomonas jaspsi]
MEPDFSDAKALLSRAKRHYNDFNQAVHGKGLSTLWKHSESFDPRSFEWYYSLTIDRQRLIEAKPTLADAANNVVSALDHVISAVAKPLNAKRDGLYFPRPSPLYFQKDLKGISKRIGIKFANVIDIVHRTRYERAHVQAAREIANSGKHWELPLANGSLVAVALHLPTGQRIISLPEHAFRDQTSHEYYRDRIRLPNVARSIVIGQRVEGLSKDLPASPDSIFPCAFRYVEAIIDAMERAAFGGIIIKHGGKAVDI